MNKIKVTAEEYNKIAEGQASLFWRKVFAIPENVQGEERKELKRKFDNEYNDYMSQYEIISFSINTECEELKKLINNTCHKEEKEKESVLYKGHILTSDKILNFVFNNKYEIIELNHYTIASFNAEYKTIIQYCEGDIYINIFDTVEAFKSELKRVKKWYKENY